MTPLPRNAALDDRLAAEGPTSEALQVYADWLADRDHPLAEWIRDGVRAEAGDAGAVRRLRERGYAAPHDDERLTLVWRLGVISGIEIEPTDYDDTRLLERLVQLLGEPWSQLATSVRAGFGQEVGLERDLQETLAALPPSIGRLAVHDARFPAVSRHTEIDLSSVRCPSLRDLRLRAAIVRGLPARLDRVRRLELCVREPGPLDGRALPALEVLHAWTGLGREALGALARSAPALRVLGLHHQGPLAQIADWPVADGVEELILAVTSANRFSLAALDRRLPASVRTVRLAWTDSVPSALPPRFTRAPGDDVPLFV